MGVNRRQFLFNQIIAADPTKNSEDIFNGDIEETYHSMLNAGTVPSFGTSLRSIKSRPGVKVSVMGDSISQVDETETGVNNATSSISANSWFSYACLLSGGLLRRGHNAGIAGQTSSNMVPRFMTDIVAHNPSTVIILCGTNDIGQAVSAGGSTPDATVIATFQSNIKQMVNMAKSNGIEPVLCTILPNNVANRKTLIIQLNIWLKLFAASNGLIILDFYTQAVDPVTGNYSTAMATGDGTHPGNAGQVILGQYVANKLGPLVGVNAPFIPSDNNDPVNLITNGLFGGGALSAQGIPPGWSIGSGYGTGLTVSYVTDSAVSGNMWQVNASASSGPYYVGFNLPNAKWSPGDVLAACGIVTSNGGIIPDINFSNQSGIINHVTKFSQAVTRGYFYLEQIVPSNATAMYFNVNGQNGTGIYSVGQVGVYNLTKLGFTS